MREANAADGPANARSYASNGGGPYAEPHQAPSQPHNAVEVASIVVSSVVDTAVAFWHERILGKDPEDREYPREETFAHERQLVEAEVASFIDDGEETAEEKLHKRVAKESSARKHSLMGKMRFALNPLAMFLGPVQHHLAIYTPLVRRVRYAIMWNDRIFSFWLVIAVFLVTLIFTIIPWAWVIYWGCRVGSLLLFGPHMHLLGRKIDDQREELREASRRYRDAGKAEKDVMVDEYREALMKDARLRIQKAEEAQDAKSERERAKHAYLHSQKYIVLNRNTRGNANIKFIASADPSRSSVHAISDPAPVVARHVALDVGQGGLTDLV